MMKNKIPYQPTVPAPIKSQVCSFFSSFRSFIFFIFITIFPFYSSFASSDPVKILDILGLGESGDINMKIIQIILAVTILSLAPAILVMVTSFTRIVIVLSFIRSAIGLQQTPPNQVIISLALFLTMFIMTPTFEDAYESGLKPMIEDKITQEEALPKVIEPFKKFMIKNTRSKDIELFATIAKIQNTDFINLPIQVVIPSFMISELRKAFEIGFLIFLPFLIIDIVVASVLMAMGMMMMPPVMLSLPFKIIFFVIIEGWYILAGSLVKSFS